MQPVNNNRIVHIERADFSALSETYADQIINRFDLAETEELWDFMEKIYMAIQLIADDNGRAYWLIGVFDDHIIIEDSSTGKLYRLALSRGENDAVVLSGMIQVKVQYVPVTATETVTRSAEEPEGGSEEEEGAEPESSNENSEGDDTDSSEGTEESIPVVRMQIPPVKEKISWRNTLLGNRS